MFRSSSFSKIMLLLCTCCTPIQPFGYIDKTPIDERITQTSNHTYWFHPCQPGCNGSKYVGFVGVMYHQVGFDFAVLTSQLFYQQQIFDGVGAVAIQGAQIDVYYLRKVFYVFDVSIDGRQHIYLKAFFDTLYVSHILPEIVDVQVLLAYNGYTFEGFKAATLLHIKSGFKTAFVHPMVILRQSPWHYGLFKQNFPLLHPCSHPALLPFIPSVASSIFLRLLPSAGNLKMRLWGCQFWGRRRYLRVEYLQCHRFLQIKMPLRSTSCKTAVCPNAKIIVVLLCPTKAGRNFFYSRCRSGTWSCRKIQHPQIHRWTQPRRQRFDQIGRCTPGQAIWQVLFLLATAPVLSSRCRMVATINVVLHHSQARGRSRVILCPTLWKTPTKLRPWG